MTFVISVLLSHVSLLVYSSSYTCAKMKERKRVIIIVKKGGDPL